MKSALKPLCTIHFLLSAALVANAAAALPATAASTSNECAPSSSRVLRLHVINEAGAAPETLDAATEEASAIWAKAGLRLTWTAPPVPVDLRDNRTVIVIVRRALQRRSAGSAPRSKGRAVPQLGRTLFDDDGVPANLIEVSFEAIVSLVMCSSHIDRRVAKLPDLTQRFLLGRGLGRVTAHEVGHWLVGRGHAEEGLMKPAFGDHDLVESFVPQLPRAWTAAGPGLLMARFSRCQPMPLAD